MIDIEGSIEELDEEETDKGLMEGDNAHNTKCNQFHAHLFLTPKPHNKNIQIPKAETTLPKILGGLIILFIHHKD